MVNIRHAREADRFAIAQTGYRAWEQAMLASGERIDMRDSAIEAFKNFARSSWDTITLIENNGMLGGWAAREKRDDFLSDLWIEPKFQRRGLGTRLVQEMERTIQRAGYEAIRLETHSRNTAALGFFKMNGYSVSWLSMVYSPKLDREIHSVGLAKPFLLGDAGLYGPAP